MADNNIDCWYHRVSKIKSVFNLPDFNGRNNSDSIGKHISNIIESKFSLFWKQEVNRVKQGLNDDTDHNKLRFYKSLKSTFDIEPYVESVQNRNQRAWLSRIRISAHRLHIETGRYHQPVTPVNERVCHYCDTLSIDDEEHLLTCPTFSVKRNCLYGKISAINPPFLNLSNHDKMLTLFCPADPKIAKLVNKYIGIVFSARTRLDNGEPLDRGNVSKQNINDSDAE